MVSEHMVIDSLLLHPAAPVKLIYFFGDGRAEGNAGMKEILGGKGAGLAEMTNAGLPVPPGFTIQTAACREFLRTGQTSPELEEEMLASLHRLEELTGQRFGDPGRPLLVSVRSGAKFSMPGMMDTVLNVGLNDHTMTGLVAATGDRRFAIDCYRRLLQVFGSVVLGIPKQSFDETVLRLQGAPSASLAEPASDEVGLERLIDDYKQLIQRETGREFPQDPFVQLSMARDAVFRSWNGARARHYRRMNGIPEDLGTAVNVQVMVFGNLGSNSGTGVGFTRNPATGAKEFFGEFLPNAQGEDVVAGVRTPLAIASLQHSMPDVYQQLEEMTTRMERHYRDVQDFEFTVQQGRLYMLQTRNGKRTGRAAVRIALEMLDEGLISETEAVFRVEPGQLFEFVVPVLDESQAAAIVLTRGLAASPGAAIGQIVFTAERARELVHEEPGKKVILLRTETTPEDIHGMEVAAGILTSRGGMTSHAAVVGRGMGRCCVVGAGELDINQQSRTLSVAGRVFHEGDWLSLDGNTGRVLEGKLRLKDPSPDDPLLTRFMRLIDPHRRMRVRANADIPRDALKAREFGAEGIGLCRTEHMFFAPERIAHIRSMILATDAKQRREALEQLLPLQRADFVGLFRAMNGLPVTIRLLDPPLHEFLPTRETLMTELFRLEQGQGSPARLEQVRRLLKRTNELHEQNPMLGHRGCRLGISHPEITEMQARAIFEAAVQAVAEGISVKPEIMVPLVGTPQEMKHQRNLIEQTAEQVFSAAGHRIEHTVGTMIELPRAAVCAGDIATQADFFSFGTNDLTQMTFGFSRDDINKFLPKYIEEGILKEDPFATLDQEGVGSLVTTAIANGRAAKPQLKIGICGEHGGDPRSITFFHDAGLDYVSCSPYRVLTARLAAAQATLKASTLNAPSTM
jgi:pyruvate, orthophosphate dikinase